MSNFRVTSFTFYPYHSRLVTSHLWEMCCYGGKWNSKLWLFNQEQGITCDTCSKVLTQVVILENSSNSLIVSLYNLNSENKIACFPFFEMCGAFKWHNEFDLKCKLQILFFHVLTCMCMCVLWLLSQRVIIPLFSFHKSASLYIPRSFTFLIL